MRLSTKITTCTFLWLGTFAICQGVDATEEWISIGPFGTPLANHDVIGGQVNALAVHPKDANTVYVGASEGGVWRTSDGGATWAALTDTQLFRPQPSGKPRGTVSIGSLAIDPVKPQTIYAGTGDPNVACCFVDPGLGVFRSTDAGNTWNPTGVNLTQAQCENGAMSMATVNRMLVVPGRPTVVFAATNAGLFSYLDNGNDCWKRVTNGLPTSGNAIDLVADPYHATLYVAFHSQGIFRSTDLSGGQWTKLAGGLPTTDFGRIALAFGGRTGIGFSQPLPLLYAGFDANGTYRLFKTTDGGGTWNELPSPPSDGQLDFNNAIAVGQYDSNEVYIGQIAFWRATDGGSKGGANNYKVNPPVTDNSWTVLGCCLSDSNPFRKNLDLHGDLHDIVFAPYGSFIPSPSQIQIVYVAGDGGITKGNIDSDGVVSWVPLTKGLAIGQGGTIGLDPGNASVTVTGLWHNGDIITLSNTTDSLPITGGDGFQTTIDAGNLTVYINCNAGFGGEICRALPPAPFFTTFQVEKIWSDSSTRKHWSDPHRPGNLLRLQKNGLLFRTKVANTATAAVLNTADAWEAVDPFWGKTGNTTTMAFRSRVLEEQPIYYIGTDTGQVWRGSPEAGWNKLAECGAPVNGIAADLFRNERLFVALKKSSGPGRIKELDRLTNGTWATRDIDSAFTPDLDVKEVSCVAVDPAETHGTTIYAGTDQGMYRGHFEPLVLDPTVSALVYRPPVFGDWTWRRSPGVPNVWVTDLEVHQNFQAHDSTGIVRAGTYGRGIFELDRISATGPFEKLPATLSVQAIQTGEDGAPSPLTVKIPVVMKDKKFTRDTPFELTPPKGTEVSLQAPGELREENEVLKFVGWANPGKRSSPQTKISVKLAEAVKAIAYYEREKRIPDPKAKSLHVTVSTDVKQICVQSFTHELTVSWEVTDGQRPVSVRAEIIYPDKHVERVEFKPIEGSQTFPVNAPKGGDVKVKVMAVDSAKASSAAESKMRLKPCRH